MKDLASETPLDVNLFQFTSGPHDAKILLVGEAWGASEVAARRPFVGASGHELDKMLYEAGLPRNTILCSNLIHAQPAGNDFTRFLYSNDEAKTLKLEHYHGTYPRSVLRSGINNLWALLDQVNPSLVIAAGNWPLWCLSEHSQIKTSKGYKLPTGITSWRGSQTYSRVSPKGRRYSLLPIIHPAAILREWGYRHVTCHDLRSRARRFLSGSLQWQPPSHTFLWRPSFDDTMSVLNAWIAISNHRELWLSVDLETYKRRFVSVLGLADSDLAICNPFLYYDNTSKRLKDYFTHEEETSIWLRAKTLLENPNTKIIGQNFIYDTQFLSRHYDIRALVALDTMVAHHLLFPGTPKGLHNLASLYCDHYCYWKDESADWDSEESLTESMWRYNCKDTRATFEIAMLLKDLIASSGMTELYNEKLAQWRLAREMTLNGINIDTATRREFSLELFRLSNELEQWLLSSVPDHLKHNTKGGCWASSSKATQRILYSTIGIPPILHKKTKKPTLDDDAINTLLARPALQWLEPLLGRLAAYRSVGVFKENFVDARLGLTGRLHSQFNVAHPETHRWSSAKTAFGEGTNLQNIPKVED